MKKHDFWDYQVELDRNTTAKWYAQFDGWGCDCDCCRNFIALAQKKVLPQYVSETLDELGMSPEKATYVCGLNDDDAGYLPVQLSDTRYNHQRSEF